jgi:Domain of unknown function (DUF5979)
VRAIRAWKRPQGWALLVAVALAAGVPLVGGTLGGAQTLAFTLTVKKVVTGVVPPGTTFTVTVSCVLPDSAGTGAGSSDATAPTTDGTHSATLDGFPSTITFNANGDPTTTNTGSLNPAGDSCTVAENPPGTGGAQSVSYGCATTNASEVACDSNQQVRVIPDHLAGAAATITVTNVFPPPPPPPVIVAPQFTG